MAALLFTTAAFLTNAMAQPVPKRQPVDFEKMPVAIEYKVQKELELAELALSQQLEDKARTHFSLAIEISPNRAETYYAIGQLFASSQMIQSGSTIAPRYGEARLWWEQYLELADPRDKHWADVHMELGQQDYDAYFANDELEQYRLAFLERAEYHLLRAYESYLDDQRLDKLSISHASGNQLEYNLAIISERYQRYDDALRYLRAAESRLLNSDLDLRARLNIRRGQMWNLFWLGRDEEAFAISKATYELFTFENNHSIMENISVSLMMSSAYLKLGHFEESLEYAALAESIVQPDLGNPSNPLLALIKSHTANIYFEMGNLEMAELLYREALNNSTRPTYKNNLAWAIVVRSDVGDVSRLTEARLLSEAAVELSPSAANLDTLAEVYARLERYDDALELIEEALLIHSSDPTLGPYLKRQHKRLTEASTGFALSSEDYDYFRIKLWHPPIN